jgi:hypothetical protein
MSNFAAMAGRRGGYLSAEKTQTSEIIDAVFLSGYVFVEYFCGISYLFPLETLAVTKKR